jgi:hypothetical protein
MPFTDKFNDTRKLREGEREKKREREWSAWSLAFGSVDIQWQLPISNKQRFQRRKKWQKHLFLYICYNSVKIDIIHIFNS